MPLPFNKDLDLRLIALVKDNAVLYNPRHPRYMDYDSREVVWQKIGDLLNRPPPLCKSRWINIRDMMRRKYKERLLNPNHRVYNYKYETELAFMTPFYKEIHTSEDLAEFLDEEASCEVQVPAEVFVTENGEFEEKEIKLNFRKHHDDSTSSNARDYNESVLQELNPTDPIDVFLITIGTTLKKFSPYYLNQAKSKIFQVVQSYELEQIVKEDGHAAKEQSDSNR